jgi:16S rRNA processing protein RimM
VVTEPRDPGEPQRLVVGYAAKPHGNRGELFIWPLTDRPVEVFAPGRDLLLGDETGAADEAATVLVVDSVREFKRGLLVQVVGVETRSAAEALCRRYLLAPREALEPLEEGEVFYHQLLGASVETVAGSAVGTVREVYETEPAHLLEVESPQGKRHLVPFTERVIRKVDPAAKRVVIDPPEGLLEL